ncbi:hypothetical protein [Marinagarivorans algicola]|uniref:hypothetical protein n=1 Tax=Marinagarivorans algicola TaxID=1513270 RepID=UPI0037368D04
MACHNASIFALAGGDLNLESETLGVDMLEQPSQHGGSACADEKMIDATDPANSLFLKLLRKKSLNKLNATACVRQPMPPNAVTHDKFLSGPDFRCLSNWVAEVAATEVAKENGDLPDFVPVKAQEALAKAKYMLHGGAPTAKELRALGGPDAQVSPEDLKHLIAEWEQTPEYQTKLERFFLTTFQINSLGNPGVYNDQFWKLAKYDGLNKDNRNITLIQSFRDMMVKTAWRIYDNEQPFSEVVTTRKWEVTSAILASLAYLEKGKGLAERKSNKKYLGEYEYFQASDFSDWKTVTIEQSDTRFDWAPDSSAMIESLRDIEDGSRISMVRPMVGFFSTPAFYAIWQTNEDNQFRVTTHQTLIIALDKEFEISDATPHSTENGIPPEHADPSTVCYNCHRHMDPMRLAFMNTINTHNHAIEPESNALTPSFSFFGVNKSFNTIDDLAKIIAEHPEFPKAWIQKLCMWGNSQRCDDTDPEFKRIVQVFKDNNLNYRLAVREFFSSPLFTGTELTKNHETHEFILSLSRGDHLCQAMQNRLDTLKGINNPSADTIEVCPKPCFYKNGKFLKSCRDEKHFGLIPPDTFDRAKTDFVQVFQVGPFDVKSLDQKCAQLAEDVVKNTNKGIINSAQDIDKTIGQLVEHIIGLPKNHLRHDELTAGLKRIYDLSTHSTACSSGVNPTQQNAISCGYSHTKLEAVRNLFFAACSSPDILSIGM